MNGEERASYEMALKARQAAHAYNAGQYIVLALREMASLPLNQWTVDAQAMLASAHTNLQELMQSLQPKPEPKPKGKVIDIEFYPDPFSEELGAYF